MTFALPASIWLGFGFDSTRGYPGEGPTTSDTTTDDQLTEAAELWLMQLAEEKRLVEALPFVKGEVAFHQSDISANRNKVLATVWCCWEPARSALKQIAECCNESGERPTHLEALRALREKLLKNHGCANHVVHERAAGYRKDFECNSQEPGPKPMTAFNRMVLASAAQQRMHAQAKLDEQNVAAACVAEQKASKLREAAEARLKASKAAADALQPPTASHKKQKTAFSAGTSNCAPQGDACAPCGGEDDEPMYSNWTTAKWKELENKEQKRRNTPIDAARHLLPSLLD
jgi:hypothetical protein